MQGDLGHVLFMTNSVVYGVLFPKSTLLYSWVLFPTSVRVLFPLRCFSSVDYSRVLYPSCISDRVLFPVCGTTTIWIVTELVYKCFMMNITTYSAHLSYDTERVLGSCIGLPNNKHVYVSD